MSYYLIDVCAAFCTRCRAHSLRMQARVMDGSYGDPTEVPLDLDTPPIFECFALTDSEVCDRVIDLDCMASRQGFEPTAVRMRAPECETVTYDCASPRRGDLEVN